MNRPLASRYYFLRSYFFSDAGIIIVRGLPLVYFFILAGLMTIVIYMMTGIIGGFIGGASAGIASWLILSAAFRTQHDKLTKYTFEELSQRKGSETVPLSQVSWIKLTGESLGFSFEGKVYKSSVRERDIQGFVSLIDRIEMPDRQKSVQRRVPTQSSPLAVSAVGVSLLTIAVLGLVLLLVGNLYTFVTPTLVSPQESYYLVELGLLLPVDAGAIYGILRPSLMSPIPRWFVYVGLATLNLSEAFEMATGGPMGLDWNVILIFNSLGIVSTTVVATSVATRLVQSRYRSTGQDDF